MAYLSLYRKYRSQTFDEILGQSHVSETLSNAILEDRVAHAYLFTGPRGTGKTSTARILAKALNCAEGPTPSPCGKCQSCRSITDGSSLDVIEMDAASHSKVDETREILAGVPLASAGGRKKVYVIDEVHMLSTQAFNALLKTLEEPPPHVVFILATTEAHKVLPTIISRTQRFDFRRIPSEILQTHLHKIAELEGIDIEPEALATISRHADGGARDALSLLDQARSLQGHISESDVEAMLGSREEDSLYEVFDAVAAGDVGALFVTVHSLVSQGGDARQIALHALSHGRSLLLLLTAPDSEGLLDLGAEEVARLQTQAQRFTPASLLAIIDLLGKAITEMRTAPDHRLLLEVALVRAADPATDPSSLGLLGRLERLERRMGIDEPASTSPAPVATPASAERPARRPASTPRKQQAAPPRSAAAPTPAQAPAPAPTQAPAPAPTQGPASTPTQAPVPAADQEGVVGFNHVRDAWSAALGEVGKRSRRIQAFLNPSRPLSFNGNELVVEVQSSFHEGVMGDEPNRAALTEALHAALGIRPILSFVARGADAAPMAAEKKDPHPEPEGISSFDEAVTIEHHELDAIELVKRGLGAEIVEERTK